MTPLMYSWKMATRFVTSKEQYFMKNTSNDLNYFHGDHVRQLSFPRTSNARSAAICAITAENSRQKTRPKQLVQVKNCSLCEDDYWRNGILGEKPWRRVYLARSESERMRVMVKLKK